MNLTIILLFGLVIYFLLKKNNNLENFTQTPSGFDNIVLSNSNGYARPAISG